MYKLHLILKYLRKRRLAWVSLAAVTLCTMMVLVVISVMGGWLRMFKTQYKGVSGDIIVNTPSMSGFAGYEKMLDDIRALPQVKAAAPVIKTYGLIEINDYRRDGVQVIGYPPEIQQVNSFRDSCHLIGGNFQGVLVSRKRIDQVLSSPDPGKYALDPEFVAELPDSPMGILADGEYHPFTPDGNEQAKAYLKTPNASPRVRVFASTDENTEKPIIQPDGTIHPLYLTPDGEFPFQLWYNRSYYNPRNFKGDVKTWGAMVVGAGVVGIRRNEDGVVKHPPQLLIHYADLTVLPISNDSSSIDPTAKQRGFYWIVDDSRTGVSTYDSANVYVAFDRLQRDLQMDAHDDQPARCHQIQIALKPGADVKAVRDQVQEIIDRNNAPELKNYYEITAVTWDELHSQFIGAVEKEKGMLTFLFGVISLVAVFMIFCIFYMIVAEKTRDIGILKSIGATSRGIAAIFLGYGAVIGIIGATVGFLWAWRIVHNINEIHTFLGKNLGLVVWDPRVYIFDTIPNTMNPVEVIVIMCVAIFSSILGSLIPAIRAAWYNPVEALRWE